MLNKRISTMTKTLACLVPLGIATLGANALAAPPQADEALSQQTGGCEQPSPNLGQGQGGPGYGQGPWKSMGGQGPGMGRGGPGEGRGAGSRRAPMPPAYGQEYPAYAPGYGPGYPAYGYGPGYSYPMPPAAPYGPAQPYAPRP
jgi:hypothetical protein